MGEFDYSETTSDRIVNPRVSALFVFLLAIFVYMFFALQSAEAETTTVEVKINGLATTQSMAYRTVGELIDSLYPDGNQIIDLSPGRSTEITPNLNIEVKVDPAKVNRTVADNLEAIRPPQAEPIVVATTPKTPKIVEPKSPTYSGTATWYRFGNKLTAASTQFPKGTRLRVTADATGKYVDVEINDYGPTAETGVSLDLNSVAFTKLAPLGAGRINIHYFVI
ncbi:RlpA-like double-psi beta-barrel domain-containing protein [Patescibacteria group bacterium]|nr:RlpA-like double-psi beta-barrel domain-containing protein [Patescibacteria group bacterium]